MERSGLHFCVQATKKDSWGDHAVWLGVDGSSCGEGWSQTTAVSPRAATGDCLNSWVSVSSPVSWGCQYTFPCREG